LARGDDIEERLIEFALSNYQHQHFNCSTGNAQLTIQQFSNSTIQQFVISSPPQPK